MKNAIHFHVRCVVDDSKPAAPSPVDIKEALIEALTSPDSEYGVSDVVVTWIPNPDIKEGWDR